MLLRAVQFLAGLVFLIMPAMLCAEEPATWPALDEELEEIYEDLDLPGLAVGVVKDGEVAYLRGFGMAKLEIGPPVTADSVFHVASVSKTFVATAIMQLVEQGKIDLDEPVMTYLPYFRLDDERYTEITVRHMLSHRSGMPDVRDYQWDSPEPGDDALEKYVRTLSDRKLLAAPGESFMYSNMAYDVLGDVIARASGRTFEQYMKEELLDPLGMTESTFLYEETSPELRTTPHVGYPDPSVHNTYPYNRIHAPSSTLQSSAREMCNWLLVQLNRGALGEERLLQAASYDELWKSYSVLGRGRSIGLGWFVDTTKGRLCIHHGGADEGFQALIMLFPDDAVGLVILANCTRFRMRQLKTAIVEQIFEEEG